MSALLSDYASEDTNTLLVIEISPLTDQPTGSYRVVENNQKNRNKYFDQSNYVVVYADDPQDACDAFHALVDRIYYNGNVYYTWRSDGT